MLRCQMISDIIGDHDTLLLMTTMMMNKCVLVVYLLMILRTMIRSHI